MKKNVRVLVVDDSAYTRQAIKGMLETDPDIEVIGIARNGLEAIAKVKELNPDVITLDFEMPGMDGFSFLRWLMREKPTPVIMISSHSDSKTVFMALELGAADFVTKPTGTASGLNRIQDELLEKVRGIKDLRLDRVLAFRDMIRQPEKDIEDKYAPLPAVSLSDMHVVAIGSSTGGPAALQVILSKLKADLPSGIVISQHMPKGFTEPFAERLDRLSQIRVKEAEDGDPLDYGTAYICPGGSHLLIRRRAGRYYVNLKDPSEDDRYIPSVDLMMRSVAQHFGPRSIGVVLTGMGNDGTDGIVEIKNNGGYTITESESTAVVYGMPNEAFKTGRVDMVLPVDRISDEIMRSVSSLADKKKRKPR